jgi:serine protease Do
MNAQRTGSSRAIRSICIALVSIGFVVALAGPAAAQANRQAARELSSAFSAAAKEAMPAVVSIKVEKTVNVGPLMQFGGEGGFNDPFSPFGEDFLRKFFGGRLPQRQSPQKRYERGQGSGFIISKDGYILTNNHVVGDVDKITVELQDGRKFENAKLIGTDPASEVALIKIEGKDFPVLPMGDSDKVEIGDWVVAIGNPFGLSETVTVGVISAVGRSNVHIAAYEDFIQTDAAINPGNSGGPLVNAEGSVIGVNSAILSQSGGSEGIGFAIPIDRARRIAEELLQYGRIRRPWVGVESRTVESETTRFSLTEVRRVAPGSSADGAGLQVGDLLLSVNDRPITSPLDWDVGLLDAGVGGTVDVTYRRGERILTARLAIEELPSEQAERLEVVRGLELITVTPQIAVERGLEVEKGALVARLSNAAGRVTGLREGDVIVGINRRPVESVEDAQGLFRALAGGSRIFVTYYRDGRYYSSWPFDIG